MSAAALAHQTAAPAEGEILDAVVLQPMPAATTGKKTPLLRWHLILKMIILSIPRQARDKHRKNSTKEWRFLTATAAGKGSVSVVIQSTSEFWARHSNVHAGGGRGGGKQAGGGASAGRPDQVTGRGRGAVPAPANTYWENG